MRVRFTKEHTVGNRTYGAGQVATVPDDADVKGSAVRLLRVKFTRDQRIGGQPYAAQMSYDVPEDAAKKAIADGAAVEEKPAAEKTATAKPGVVGTRGGAA